MCCCPQPAPKTWEAGRPWAVQGGWPGTPCLRERDHIRWGMWIGDPGLQAQGTHGGGHFPAAAAALIEDCLEQRGFPPINVLLWWKGQFIPPRVIASRLSVNSGETLHLVQVSGFLLQWRGQDCYSCVRGVGLEGAGMGDLPPSHCLTSAMLSTLFPLFCGATWHLLVLACWGVWHSCAQGCGRGRGQGLLWDLSERQGGLLQSRGHRGPLQLVALESSQERFLNCNTLQFSPGSQYSPGRWWISNKTRKIRARNQ